MYDNVDHECICPVCKSKVSGFQSKDGDCVLDALKVSQVANFYSSCHKCGCWIEFNRIEIPTNNFIMKVGGKKGKPLDEFSKEVTIKEDK